MRILYLDLDALNPTHLSCYGYHRRTSPNIDRIASEGTRLTNVYCSDAPCLPSRTAFYSGRFGIQTGVVGHGGTAGDPKPGGPTREFRNHFEDASLARQLQDAGYYTAMISPFAQRHAAHHVYAGFREIHNTGKRGNEIAPEVQPVVEDWLDRHAGRDCWYLHVNFWDIHTEYRTPEAYGNPFSGQPVADWYTDQLIDSQAQLTGPHTATDLGHYQDGEDRARTVRRIDSMAALTKHIDGYDTAIRYVDDHIARIVEKLKSAGVYDDTMIVISADHGENQGDLGVWAEHGTADHATCHIPFIVKGPGVRSNQVDQGLHYHLDWAPTLMALLGLKSPEIWDGLSFAGALNGDGAAGRDDLVVSQCAHICQRSVRWNDGEADWLYLRTYHDGFNLFPAEMLFDLISDPHELNDLAEIRPPQVREGAWRLAHWHDSQMEKMAQACVDVVDPLWTVMREGGPYHANSLGRGTVRMHGGLDGYLERLRQTGRARGASELQRRHAWALR